MPLKITSPAACNRTFPSAAEIDPPSAIEIEPASASTSIVPAPPVVTETAPIPTFRPASNVIFPEPERTSAFTAKSETAPPASSKIFPVPCAETATPSAEAVPSFNVKFPATVRKIIDPFPPNVRTSDCAASVTTSATPSIPTRKTETATSSTASIPVFKILMLPVSLRALNVATAVRNAFAPTPSVPTPVPAANRNPFAATSTSAFPPLKTEPATDVIETFPLVAIPPTTTSSPARKRISAAPPSKTVPSPITIDPEPASRSSVFPLPETRTPAAKRISRPPSIEI